MNQYSFPRDQPTHVTLMLACCCKQNSQWPDDGADGAVCAQLASPQPRFVPRKRASERNKDKRTGESRDRVARPIEGLALRVSPRCVRAPVQCEPQSAASVTRQAQRRSKW